ncbi:MAG TPA: dephospho-CoA kinase, partial [Kiloniellales bacterium]|nr:dephospho-CoA kinase [Kiloniellales bacterium]
TAARQLRRLGLPLHDADAAIHRLYAPGGKALAAVARRFPEAIVNGGVDRQRLGQLVFGRPEALRDLERMLHPLVRRETLAFLQRQARRRRPLVVLDIPLLFETGGEADCDYVIAVSAPGFLQRQRALSRPGMTQAKLDGILARQTSDREKRRRADYVVPSGLGYGFGLRHLKRAVRLAKGAPSRAWPPAPQRLRRLRGMR